MPEPDSLMIAIYLLFGTEKLTAPLDYLPAKLDKTFEK